METLKLEITIKMLCTLVQDNFEQILSPETSYQVVSW